MNFSIGLSIYIDSLAIIGLHFFCSNCPSYSIISRSIYYTISVFYLIFFFDLFIISINSSFICSLFYIYSSALYFLPPFVASISIISIIFLFLFISLLLNCLYLTPSYIDILSYLYLN